MQKLNAQVLRIYPLLSYDSSRRIHHESKSSSETRFTVADVSSMKNAYSVVQNSDIMAKRNKKPTVRRQDRLGLTKLKIGKSNKGLKMEEQIDKTRSFTTGNNILNEQTVISDHRDSNVMDGSSSREQDLVQSSSSPADYTRTQERSVAVETLPKSDSEVTLSDLLIDLNDIKMEMIPPQTTENTIIVSPNISDIPQVSKLTTEKDNLLIEPKNDLSLPGTSLNNRRSYTHISQIY
ncbi:hypothetical protein GE061_002112 [Apolygus lucorum]|uniref:Uncharacterized protein n=1 Tax=Apolygus lucorum TaxID=248454 RepID=A0A8S9X472_APOLU|nr:hypothetical protein GE061_002112 [Apolygus lucorum]